MKHEITSLCKSASELADAECYVRAREIVEKVIVCDPENPLVWNTRSYINACEGCFEDAVDDLSKSVLLCNHEPHPYFTRGRLLLKLGRFEEAIDDFNRVLELCDRYNSDYYRRTAYFFRADAYARTGKFSEALSDCDHIPDGTHIWTDRLRTKAEIVAECEMQRKRWA